MSEKKSKKDIVVEKCNDSYGYPAWKLYLTKETANLNYGSQIDSYRKDIERYNKEYQEYLVKKAEYDQLQYQNYLNDLKAQKEDIDKKIKDLETKDTIQ